MPLQIQFNRLSNLLPNQIDQLRAIYLDSFPPFERVEFSILIDAIAESQRWLFTATRANAVIGLAIIVPHIASDFHLLEYLAVDKTTRGDGVGGMLLSQVVAAMRAVGNVSGLLLEAESDEEGDSAERQLRARRIGFYQRFGAREVECAPYYRVPLSDRPGMMRMKLLWLAINEQAQTPHGAKLGECIRGIMETSYEQSPDSALTQANLEELIC